MDWLDLRYSSWPGWCATWKWQVRSSLWSGIAVGVPVSRHPYRDPFLFASSATRSAYALRSETRLFPRKRKNPPLLSPTLAGVGGNGRTGIVLRYGYLKLER